MHLFEFMDLDWLPQSLRHTLRDILECGNGRPFRTYYSWVVDEVIRIARETDATTIVELGCGTAPISRRLARHPDLPGGIQLVPCDLNPEIELLRQLESDSKGKIKPIYEPVDFSREREWPSSAVLILSATFHHIPKEHRQTVLNALGKANEVLIFEPLRNTLSSLLFVVGSLVPALLTPVRYIRRPGSARRIVWCWLLPVAPLMFLWDGWISCLRQTDWQTAQLASGVSASHQMHLFSTMTRLRQEKEAACRNRHAAL